MEGADAPDPAASRPDPAASRMEGHVRIVAVLHYVFAGIAFLAGIAVLLLFGIARSVTGESDVAWLPEVLAHVGILLALVPFALALLYGLAGAKLSARKASGRTLGLVAAVLSLPSIPFGTAFGAYTLWVLLQADTARLLR